MCHELVGRGPKRGVAGGGTVLRAVDVSLEVLDAHAHGESLAVERHAQVTQELEDVASGMSASEDEGIRAEALLHEKAGRLSALERHRLDVRRGGAARHVDAHEPRAEADLAAKLADARADVIDDARQDVGADVRLRVPGDLWRSARLNEGIEDEAVQGALRAGGELAVGEGSGAARAELDVALAVELARLVEAADGLATATGVVTALDQDGVEPGGRERERAEKARATCADHDGPVGWGLRDAWREQRRVVLDLLNTAVVLATRELSEKGPLRIRPAAQRHPRRHREVYVVALAGVDGATAQLDTRDVVRRDV